MTKATIILGNQLFPIEFLKKQGLSHVFMAEVKELIREDTTHKQKIWLFLSAMRRYREELGKNGLKVEYNKIDDHDESYTELLGKFVNQNKIKELYIFEIEDQWFARKLKKWALSSRSGSTS